MRTVSIPNTNIYSEKHHGATRWVVYLGRRFTASKPAKKRFPDYAAAKDWLLGEVQKREQQGASGYQLTPAQAEQAARAFAVLAGRATLAQAVEDFVRRKFPIAGTRTLAEVVTAWVERKKAQGRSADYLAKVTDIYREAARTLPGNVSDITSKQIERFLRGKKKKDGQAISANSFNHYRNDLSALWNFAISEGWAAHNPCSNIEEMKGTKPAIGILPPHQTLAVLRAAADAPDSRDLAFFVLSLFAGIRTAEIRRLTWADVVLDDGEPRVIIPANAAKDEEGRVIDLTPNAAAWLALVDDKHGAIGSPHSDRLTALRKAAGAWPHNGGRHSFVSYKARLAGESAASEAAGHESVAMTRKRYKALVSRRAAEAYFGIFPTTTPEHIASMLAPTSPGPQGPQGELIPLPTPQSLTRSRIESPSQATG